MEMLMETLMARSMEGKVNGDFDDKVDGGGLGSYDSCGGVDGKVNGGQRQWRATLMARSMEGDVNSKVNGGRV